MRKINAAILAIPMLVFFNICMYLPNVRIKLSALIEDNKYLSEQLQKCRNPICTTFVKCLKWVFKERFLSIPRLLTESLFKGMHEWRLLHLQLSHSFVFHVNIYQSVQCLYYQLLRQKNLSLVCAGFEVNILRILAGHHYFLQTNHVKLLKFNIVKDYKAHGFIFKRRCIIDIFSALTMCKSRNLQYLPTCLLMSDLTLLSIDAIYCRSDVILNSTLSCSRCCEIHSCAGMFLIVSIPRIIIRFVPLLHPKWAQEKSHGLTPHADHLFRIRSVRIMLESNPVLVSNT